MSFAPESLKAVRHYLMAQTGKPAANFSIRAARSARGYHAGRAEIFGPEGQGSRDYSVKHPRDKAGLTNASSAIDIKLPVKQLKALTAYLVEGAQAGALDIFEVIGPDETGKANYWSIATGWQPKPKWAPASHEWHIHLGLPRDTELMDRVAMFRPFFEAPDAPALEPEPDPDTDPAPTLTDLEQMQAENEALRSALGNIGLTVQMALD